MIDLYYWTTPNGHKITIFLEEAGLDYRILPVDISAGEQFKPRFLAISPNNRIPAIVDHAPGYGDEPVSLFESGAILLYLSDKTGRFGAAVSNPPARAKLLEWLFWQMSGLGPMAGQNQHFNHHAPELIPYAMKRYVRETNRLYGVMNRRLRSSRFLAGDEYSIADIAAYPWIVPHEWQGQKLADFPSVERWFERIRARPATERAYARAEEVNLEPTVSVAARRFLFGHTAASVAAVAAE